MNEKYEGFYKCKWPGPTGGVCGCEFVATFGVIPTTKGNAQTQGQKGGCSAVKCPKCGNNLKPRLDAITVKEIKDKKGGMQNG